jgi:1-aminocyclopropane-1-carboxylate deaminase/D-cysteine desulfhydrase-like pyridoxal-dependent ACC family enzyme
MSDPLFERFPRVRLAHLPTPLEPLARLTEALGGPPILIKRDDCTGLAFGGNKTRKLEFLLADARTAGADTVITAGGLQSNHVRQTAAAANRLGLASHLVLQRYHDWPDAAYLESGNLLLDALLGARIHVAPPDQPRDQVMARLAERLSAEGAQPYVIPAGGSNAVGGLGYAAAAGEILNQAATIGIDVGAVVFATASGGTQGGLMAGGSATACCSSCQVSPNTASSRAGCTSVACSRCTRRGACSSSTTKLRFRSLAA